MILHDINAQGENEKNTENLNLKIDIHFTQKWKGMEVLREISSQIFKEILFKMPFSSHVMLEVLLLILYELC